MDWLLKFKNVNKEIKVGGFVLLGAIVLLFWNEGRAVKTTRGLEEGADAIIRLDSPVHSENNDKKLVHLHGDITANSLINDAEFGISFKALKYKREVQIYQWSETSSTTEYKDTTGKSTKKTTFSYHKEWSSDLINSSKFEHSTGHTNPMSKPFNDQYKEATSIKLGDFTIDQNIISKIDEFVPLKVDISKSGLQLADNFEENNPHSNSSNFYWGKGSPQSPEIGDARIKFFYIPNDTYSIIAQQVGHSLTDFETSSGTSILMIAKGNKSADSMFKNAEKSNKTLTWFLRIFGAIIIFGVISSVSGFAEKTIEIIPFVAMMKVYGIRVLAAIVSATISSIVIGVAWVYYRPILGGILIVTGIGIALFFYKKSLNKQSV